MRINGYFFETRNNKWVSDAFIVGSSSDDIPFPSFPVCNAVVSIREEGISGVFAGGKFVSDNVSGEIFSVLFSFVCSGRSAF